MTFQNSYHLKNYGNQLFSNHGIIITDETLKISVCLTEAVQCHKNLGDNAITSTYMIYLQNRANLMGHNLFVK